MSKIINLKNKNISFEDQLYLSDIAPKITEDFVKIISNKISEEINISNRYVCEVVKPCTLSIIYYYLDKLLRFEDYFKNEECNYTYCYFDKIKAPIDNADLKTLFEKKEYNNYLNNLFGFEIQYENFFRNDLTIDGKIFTSYKNHLFTLSNFNIYDKIIKKIDKIISLLPFYNRTPVLPLANAEFAFSKYYFYIFHFKKVKSWDYNLKKKNLKLREKIFLNNKMKTNYDLLLFFKDQKYNKTLTDLLLIKLQNLFVQIFPIQILEGLKNNYDTSMNEIAKFKSKIILAGHGGDDKSCFINSAAKEKNYRIINHQHGCGYGYLQGMTSYYNIEIPLSDYFLTWGWKDLNVNESNKKKYNLIPLPSPWLSERKKYWSKYSHLYHNKPFDVIWMPQHIRYFNLFPGIASAVSNDTLKNFSNHSYLLISEILKSKISVYCKFFNILSYNFMHDLKIRLKKLGKDNFCVADDCEKGLHYDLLNKGKIILWDQPGTGFLECVSSNIPTLVYWTRDYSKELENCIKDFEELTSVGIIHKDHKSLINELKIFLQSPIKWQNNEKRKSILSNFKNKYCQIDDSWYKIWKKTLQSLNS